MSWIEKIARGRSKSVERQIVDLEKLLGRGAENYENCQEMCSATRSIWLNLLYRYMTNPGGDRLVNATPAHSLESERRAPKGTTGFKESVYSHAADLCRRVCVALDQAIQSYSADQVKHVEQMHENIQQRLKMLEVILQPDLTYSDKLDRISVIGDETANRLYEYPQGDELEDLAQLSERRTVIAER